MFIALVGLVDDPVRGLSWQQTNIVSGPPSCLRSQSLNRTKMLPLCLKTSLLVSSSSQILRLPVVFEFPRKPMFPHYPF